MKKILGVLVILATVYIIIVHCVIAGIVDVGVACNGGGSGLIILGLFKIFFLPMTIAPLGIGGGLTLMSSVD